jgi:hypothetical protein
MIMALLNEPHSLSNLWTDAIRGHDPLGKTFAETGFGLQALFGIGTEWFSKNSLCSLKSLAKYFPCRRFKSPAGTLNRIHAKLLFDRSCKDFRVRGQISVWVRIGEICAYR